MKKLLFLFVAALLIVLLSVSAFAAEKTVYVMDGGSGDGSTAATPIGTLAGAVNALGGKGGTVVLVGDTTVSTIYTVPEQADDLIFTAQNGARLVYNGASRLQFAKNTNDNVITLDTPIFIDEKSGGQYMFGGFNSIVFTQNAKMEGKKVWFYGGVKVNDSYAKTTTIESCMTELPYSITVHEGNFGDFMCGNLRLGGDNFIGSIAAPVTVTITGGTFGDAGTTFTPVIETENPAISPLKEFKAFSVGGHTFLADDVTLNISGGTFHTPIYISGRIGTTHSPAQSVSAFVATDRKYYAQDGDVTVNISGGTFLGGAVCDTYVDAGYSRLMRGNYTVTVTGGTFTEGTVFDATQVKAYAGGTEKATLTVADGVANITPKRFDVVNGETVEYTEPTRVAFIGDSITEGHSSGNANTDSYPAAFLKTAVAVGEDVIVSNLGVSASGMLPATKYYYPAMLPYPLALEEVDADYYFFALGTNDAYSGGETEGAAEQYYTGYKAFIEAVGNLPDTDGVYVSSALIRGRGVGHYTLRAVGFVRPMQEKIANELAATDADKYHYVDLYALTYDEAIVYNEDGSGAFFADDNLHPHSEGYKVMGQCVYDAIYKGVYGVEDFAMNDVYLSDSGREFGAGTKDDPASSLSIAISKCAPNATLHIVGTSTWNSRATVPQNLGKLTIVGEGEGAVWKFSGSALVYFDCDVEIDNLCLEVTGSNYLELFGKYNNVTFGESFTTKGDIRFSAGYPVYHEKTLVDVFVDSEYDTAESVSTDKDCTVEIKNGTFKWLSAGNRRRKDDSPFGTYSGSMTFTVGAGVTVTDAEYSGLVGMNYHAGNLVADVQSFGTFPLYTYMPIGNVVGVPAYNPSKNTGNVTVTVGEGVQYIATGDVDANGSADIEDCLLVLKAMADGNTEVLPAFFGQKPSLLTALRMLVALTR